MLPPLLPTQTLGKDMTPPCGPFPAAVATRGAGGRLNQQRKLVVSRAVFPDLGYNVSHFVQCTGSLTARAATPHLYCLSCVENQ